MISPAALRTRAGHVLSVLKRRLARSLASEIGSGQEGRGELRAIQAVCLGGTHLKGIDRFFFLLLHHAYGEGIS